MASEESPIKTSKRKKKRNYSTLPAISPSSIKDLHLSSEYENKYKKKKKKLSESTESDTVATDPYSRREKHRKKAKRASSLSVKESENITKNKRNSFEYKKKKKKILEPSIEFVDPTERLVLSENISIRSFSSPLVVCKEQKIKKKKWFGKTKQKKQNIPVFGANIAELVYDSSNTREIPIIIRQCIDYLVTSDAHLLNGIFRKSGSHKVTEQLKELYDSPTTEPDISFCTDPHCVASLLKQFLASMSEPVIPFCEYETVIQNYNHFKEDNERTGVIRNLVSKIPDANRNVLLYLMRFLARVSRNSEENKMTSKNLGVVFAPTILRPAVHIPATLMDVTNTEIIQHMIDNYQQVFNRPN